MAILIHKLSKEYLFFHSSWKQVMNLFGTGFQPDERQKVLKNLSLEIRSGESVALVGQNGAGKSTLLKMIAGTQSPSRGRVICQGKIAAILELGLGFNPELTGRQNAWHGLRLQGYSNEQISEVIDKLHTFTEIGEAFDHPTRTYSSGMQARVAFAVATAFRPDILIVDEALSVGDTYFQHKSFAKIREFKEQGTTLLFVSHDKGAILELCDRAILLQQGALLMDDSPDVVMDYYNALIAEKENRTLMQYSESGGVATRSGSGELTIVSVCLLNSEGKEVQEISVGEAIEIVVEILANQDYRDAVVGYLIKDRIGQSIFGTNTHFLERVESFSHGERKRFRFKFDANLGVGSYSITVAIHSGPNHLTKNIDWQERACVFEVYNNDLVDFVGTNWLPPKFEVEKIE